MRHWLVLWLLCLGAACASAQNEPDTSRQILVLMHQPPPHFRPDAGYGGGWDDAAARKARQRVAERVAREHGLQLQSAWSMERLGLDCYVMTAPPSMALEPLVQQLSGDHRIAWAQPMQRYRAQAGGDPLYDLQPVVTAWQLPALHRHATGRGVRVAVIDSRVDDRQPDLIGQVQRQADFLEMDRSTAPERHGTAVAGIIAARAGDGVGIAGIAPQAGLHALRTCRETASATVCNSLSLALALHDAISHDVQVINLSLSGPPDRLLRRLLDVALDQGCTVVSAVDAGAADGGFPASHPGVVAVAVQPMPGRNLVVAPGQDVLAPLPGGRWQPLSGASYAAAEVSGLFALLRQLGNHAAGRQASSALVRSTTGDIDACATLAGILGSCGCDCTFAQDASTSRASAK